MLNSVSDSIHTNFRRFEKLASRKAADEKIKMTSVMQRHSGIGVR